MKRSESMKETLLKIGMTEKEAEIYLVLLRLKEGNANIIAKHAKVYRTNLYDILDALIRKGLVSYVIKNNKKLFMATDPVKLLDYIDQKRKNIDEQQKEINCLLPQLQNLYTPLKKRPIVEVYEGIEGMRTVFNQAIRAYCETKKEIIAIGAHSQDCQRLDPIYYKRHYKEKEKHNIQSRFIITEDLRPTKHKLITWRVLPKRYKSPTATYIYGNKVSFWMFLEIPTIVVVENEELSETYRNYFEYLWKIGKKVF
jgi:HTH-type transcriptional regulator, sugar sensing transcriptional regulator